MKTRARSIRKYRRTFNLAWGAVTEGDTLGARLDEEKKRALKSAKAKQKSECIRSHTTGNEQKERKGKSAFTEYPLDTSVYASLDSNNDDDSIEEVCVVLSDTMAN